tara:strand:+ start:186 stop:425 length:240 start_codon:yes stop_codon:yes gene_type:complete
LLLLTFLDELWDGLAVNALEEKVEGGLIDGDTGILHELLDIGFSYRGEIINTQERTYLGLYRSTRGGSRLLDVSLFQKI